MKKLLTALVFIISLQTNAQTYLISFAGAGESSSVSSVKVENLTAGTSQTIEGTDILRLSATTGITSNVYRHIDKLIIYPNPSIHEVKMAVFPPASGDAGISVMETSGKLILSTKLSLDREGQELIINGLGSGLYLIEIKGADYRLSGKLVSSGQKGKPEIISHSGPVTPARSGKIYNTEIKGTESTVDMTFTPGDRFKFTGISGEYSTVIPDIPSSDKTITFNFVGCTDGTGNNYPIVQIGSAKGIQTWMAENLKTVKYNDGGDIPLVTDGTAWLALTGPGYCWYNNSEAGFKDLYGALYNWHTVATVKLCPAGWHVPTHEEWQSLENYLIARGYNYDGTTASNKLSKALASSSGWVASTQPGVPGNTDYPEKRNATGFTAMPGGYRMSTTGAPFSKGGEYCYWWSASSSGSYATYRLIMYNTPDVTYYNYNVRMGMAIRCIKD